MKLCKDCRFFEARSLGWCLSPKIVGTVSYVDGSVDRGEGLCQIVRSGSDQCGKDAKWFEPKP